MAQTRKSGKVPSALQERFDEIVSITDAFSKEHLNEEYAQLIREATAALCRKRPSPLAKGRVDSWACGLVHALGSVNFLFDSTQTPHMTARQLYDAFGVSQSTGASKSKQVRDALDMSPMDPHWCLPSQIDENPLAWMIMVNGLVVDARRMPREVQEIAYEKGLIPYLPGSKPE